MLDLFGGASPSVIPQPGDEAVCGGVQGNSVFVYDPHTAKGITLGSHERAQRLDPALTTTT